MMSYKVVDRDRERLMEDLDLASQVKTSPDSRHKVDARNWFRTSRSGSEAVRTHFSRF